MSETPNSRLSKSRYRNWMFTQFSDFDRSAEVVDRDLEVSILKDMLMSADTSNRTTYYVFQLEECPRTSKLHYQGYIEFDAAMSFSFVKKLLCQAHWEPRRGSQKQAIAYCTKDETRYGGPWSDGTLKVAGKRTDIESLYAAAKGGQTHRDTAEQMPSTYMRYYKAFSHVQSMYRPSDVESVTVTLLLGPPGTGKTTWARTLGGDVMWINSVESANWFDGYDGHEDVLFDEFSGHIDLMLFLRLLAGFTERVPVKGGHCWWRPKRIYITSNYHPRLWYTEIHAPSRIALFRRITYVTTFNGTDSPTTEEGLDYFRIREPLANVMFFSPTAIKKELT